MIQHKQIFFILISSMLIPQLVIATSQSLTYDNPTNQVNISYDALNRILTKNSTGINITYSYDEQYQGTLSNITFNNSTYKYEYDDKLRVTKETRIIDGIEFEKRNYYDSMDRLIKQTLSPGKNISYYYNQQGKINKILHYVNSTFYNAFDNVLNRTYANSKIATFTYNSENGRLTQIKTDPVQQLDYSYDPVGNVLTINDSVNNRNQRMTYDLLDRLINASVGGSTYAYSYNAIGNILKIVRDSVNTTKFVYDGSSPVHAPSQVIINDAGVDVYNQSQLYSANKNRAFGFYLVNEKNTTITNANWTVDFGNNNLVNSTVAFNITTNDSVLVVVGNNYTNSGGYKVNFTGRSKNNSIDFEYLNIKFGVKILSLSVKSQAVTNTTFELVIYNDMNITSQSISWNCSTGNSSASPFTLTAYGNRTETFNYNYNSTGVKTLSCSANSTDGNDSKAINFEIKGIKIEDYNSTSTSANNRFVEFKIKNYYNPSTISWNVTSDGQTFSDQTTLGTNETAYVSKLINYTTDGSKMITVNISSGSMLDTYNDSFNLNAIRIEDFYSRNLTGSDRLYTFDIKNYWPENMSANWNISDPIVSSSYPINLSQNESAIVLIENNYTTQGKRIPKIMTYNNSFTDSFTDLFVTKMIGMINYLILSESQNNTIAEIVARNIIGPLNISWILNTGQNNITSTQPIPLNTSEEALIIIQSNYTTADIYSTNASINSTQFNDTASSGAIT